MALAATGAAVHRFPSPAFAGLDDDQLERLYGDLSDGRDALADEPLAAAALYDRPMRLVYSEIVGRLAATVATSRDRLGLTTVHYHADDPGMACVEPDAATRAVAVDALIADHDRMGHDGIGCGCLDALDAI